MASKTEYCTFEVLIQDIDPELRAICVALRDKITSLHKDFVEICWQRQKIVSYGVGPKKMSEHYVYLGLFKQHVNLGFYYGTSLDDPDGLLEGSGKNLRHIKIKTFDAAGTIQVERLIKEAIEERKSALAL